MTTFSRAIECLLTATSCSPLTGGMQAWAFGIGVLVAVVVLLLVRAK